MGLELWSYSNDSAPKSCATKRDVSAEARSPIRRRNAPPVIRRTIDLRRLPSTTFISPSVRDALRAAEISRRSRSINVADVSDVFGFGHSPADHVSARQEADSTYSRLLGMELSSRPPRDSYSRNLDENARSSDRNGPTRTTSTGSMLRRARPLRDSDDIIDDITPAINAASRRSPVAADDIDGANARYAERRRVLARRTNGRPGTRSRPSHWELPGPAPGSAHFPPLRRMGRRQVTDGPMPPSGLRQSTLRDSWSPTNVDGLGDRERSVSSPPSDHWETMLTTITPDAQLPSADSSFTSAAASASFSASNTTSQTGTQSSRSASDSSTPTELTEPSIEEQIFCETEDDLDSDDVVPPSFRHRDRDLGHTLRRARMSSNEPPRYWTTAPSPPARNPSRYADAHTRLREITNIIRNYSPSGSRSQSPRSVNGAGVDRPADSLANDDRRDSAAIVPNVSRPGSARSEQDRAARELAEHIAYDRIESLGGFAEGEPEYEVLFDPEQNRFMSTGDELRDSRPSESNHGDREDPFDFLYPLGHSDMETASMEAVRTRRRAERDAAAERAVGGRLAERPAADEI